MGNGLDIIDPALEQKVAGVTPVNFTLFSVVLQYPCITHISPLHIPHPAYDFIYLIIYFKVSGSVEAGEVQKELKASSAGFLNKSENIYLKKCLCSKWKVLQPQSEIHSSVLLWKDPCRAEIKMEKKTPAFNF